ncbi:MAG: long-chain fatty acid--CoA ligase [Actinobacteria bacterium]|nr:long-chain fatty acid--CoA ligase [Actinomycetota bacterium]
MRTPGSSTTSTCGYSANSFDDLQNARPAGGGRVVLLVSAHERKEAAVAFESIVHKILATGTERGALPAYAVRDGDRWVTTSWTEYASQIRDAAKGLIALGVEPGMPVSILGTNQPEWVVFDVAAMAIGAMPAGIYATNTPKECAYVIDHSESPVVLVQNLEQLDKILVKRSELPGLHHIVLMSDDAVGVEGVLTWDEFVAGGRDISDDTVDTRLDALGPRDGGTLIYTSGTTGPPKAVVLPHEALAYMARVLIDIVPVGPEDRVISYLPLSHIAEQVITLITPAVSGHMVYYETDIRRLAETIKEVRPTVFFAVPRVWEKFYAGVNEAVSSAAGAKKVLVDRALTVGRRHVDAINRGQTPGAWLGLQYRLFDKLVYSKAKGAMGLDQARFAFSAAAPLSISIPEFFAGLGLQILNVYGLSECTGLCAFNRPTNNRFGSVGTALPKVELKIAEDGEILTRGPNNFLGYLKNPEATAEALSEDGFLRTGDVGYIDDDGFLFITDRKKDIIITSGGENVTPSLIEVELKTAPIIGDAIVIGDLRPYLTVLVSLDAEAVEEMGLDDAAVERAVQAAIDEANQNLARVRQIKRFTILEEPFSIERGELTPTLKVRRKVIRDHYAAEIDAMYR